MSTRKEKADIWRSNTIIEKMYKLKYNKSNCNLTLSICVVLLDGYQSYFLDLEVHMVINLNYGLLNEIMGATVRENPIFLYKK